MRGVLEWASGAHSSIFLEIGVDFYRLLILSDGLREQRHFLSSIGEQNSQYMSLMLLCEVSVKCDIWYSTDKSVVFIDLDLARGLHPRLPYSVATPPVSHYFSDPGVTDLRITLPIAWLSLPQVLGDDLMSMSRFCISRSSIYQLFF